MPEYHLNHRERALSLIKARGIAQARDFTTAGIPLVYLKRLTDAGDLVRLGRGLYQDPERVGRTLRTIWRKPPVTSARMWLSRRFATVCSKERPPQTN